MKKIILPLSLLLFVVCNDSCKKEVLNPVNVQNDTTKTAPILPTYISDTVSFVSASSVAFSANVNPQGSSTSYFFEYGTIESFGNKTSTRNIGSGSTFLLVKDTVVNLSSSAIYYYRIVIMSAGGKVTGATKSFTVDMINPAIVLPSYFSDTVSYVTATSVQFSASVNPRGSNTASYFEYGTTESFGNRTSTRYITSDSTLLLVSETVANLSPSSKYYYRIVLWNTKGKVNGVTRTFSTFAPNNTVLLNWWTSNPTFSGVAFNATIIAPVGANLSFVYGVLYYATENSTTQTIARENVQTISITVNDLLPGTLYGWRLDFSGGNLVNGHTPYSTFETSTDLTNAKEFIFPLAIGSSWKYVYYYENHISGMSNPPYTSGVHSWNVVSQSSTNDSTIYNLECVVQDTARGINDTTFVNMTIPFTIAQSRYVTRINWYFVGDGYAGLDSHLVPRFVQATTADTITRPGGTKYTNGIGLSSYSFVWTSNWRVVEKWNLISFTK